ncbi:unnamed protein product [Caenorhabditis auriculariae]|uniref:Uncharacterized protein n=1 Tax=Caenorhabditis auriculariae TaxID=2777116 RepID=A0A8S1H046_9PELO|nr:unnamed protein product [Caenorhabditis auriculariae]
MESSSQEPEEILPSGGLARKSTTEKRNRVVTFAELNPQDLLDGDREKEFRITLPPKYDDVIDAERDVESQRDHSRSLSRYAKVTIFSFFCFALLILFLLLAENNTH